MSTLASMCMRSSVAGNTLATVEWVAFDGSDRFFLGSVQTQVQTKPKLILTSDVTVPHHCLGESKLLEIPQLCATALCWNYF